MPDHDEAIQPSESPGRAAAEHAAAARLFRNARREAVVVLVVWVLALVWTVGYCYLRGYEHDPNNSFERWLLETGIAVQPSPDLVAGMPDWVMFGIVVPWLACTAITVVFCLCFMKDDELGAEAGEAP